MTNPAPKPEFIQNMGWALLKGQKRLLVNLVDEYPLLEGVVNLIDAIQDYAVDDLGLPGEYVFPKEAAVLAAVFKETEDESEEKGD